jgi:hypothetical protein
VVLTLSLGSFEDRVVVAVFWLSLVLLPVDRYVRQLAALTARFELLRYLLLSSIAFVWTWAAARLRGGGGPFHLQLAGIWRGYPFPFEEWWWSDAGMITWRRDVHWLCLVGDLIPPAFAVLFIVRWLRCSHAPVEATRGMLLVAFTSVFTWLNIEPSIGGLPLTVAGPPPPFHPPAYFISGLTLGFPLNFWTAVAEKSHFGLLAANVAIGVGAWAGLYCARPLVRRHSRKIGQIRY